MDNNLIGLLQQRYNKYIYDRRTMKIDQTKMKRNLKDFDEFNKISEIVKTNSKNIINNDKLTKSLEFYTSLITSYNWLDEYNEGGCLGLLININTFWKNDKHCLKKDCQIKYVSTVFYSVNDYIKQLDEKAGDVGDFGNINYKTIIEGTLIGNNNCVLPLYINKTHWSVAKIYLKPITGIAINHNPFAHNQHSLNMVYIVLSNMCLELIKDPTCNNNNYIKTFIAVYRTATQISFDEKFNRGLTKYIDTLQNDVINDNIVSVFSQALCINYSNDDKLEELLYKYCINEAVNYKKSFVHYNPYERHNYKRTFINHDDTIDINRDVYICETIDNFTDNAKHFDTLLSTLICKNIMNSFIVESFGNFNSFIKVLEDSNTTLSDDYVEKIKEKVKLMVIQIDKKNDTIKMKIDNIKLISTNLSINSLVYKILSKLFEIDDDEINYNSVTTIDKIYELYHRYLTRF